MICKHQNKIDIINDSLEKEREKDMTPFNKKILRIALLTLSIMSLLFVIVGTPCLCCVEPISITVDSEIALCVLVPLLISIICGLVSEQLKTFSKQDALNQLEKQLNSGLIEMDKYIEMYEYIEQLDTRKKSAKIEAEKKKYIFLQQVKEKANQDLQEAKENVEVKEVVKDDPIVHKPTKKIIDKNLDVDNKIF